MVTVRRTQTFDRWLRALKDQRARVRILLRVERLQQGNPGQVAAIGAGLSELKIDTGPGYRVYFMKHGNELILLLCGGSKSSQAKDIVSAHRLAAEWLADHEKGQSQ